MIVKKIPNPKKSSTKIERITSLLEYIKNPSDENGEAKCILYGALNFMGDSHAAHIAEMSALASDCTRSADPINHYVISWKKGENPTSEQVMEAVEIFVNGLEMWGHQCVYALHADTDNMHVHIVINRVSPINERAVEINGGWDVDAAYSAVCDIEIKQGWTPEKRAIYVVKNGAKVRAVDINKKDKSPKIPVNIAKNEILKGEESALRQTQLIAPSIIASATSWLDLHRTLANNGMRYEKSGSGAKILFNDVALKASNVDRKATLKTLEKRLGVFEPSLPGQRVNQQPAKPLNEFSGEFAEYKKERDGYFLQKDKAWKAQMDAQRLRREKLVVAHNTARNFALGGDWRGRGAEKNALRKAVSDSHKKQRDQLQQLFEIEKAELRKQFAVFPAIEKWRKQRGIPSAVYVITAAAHRGYLFFPAIEYDKFSSLVTDSGIVYRNIDKPNDVAFIDTGNHICVYDHMDDEAVLAALTVAQKRFGALVIDGSIDFKQTCARLAVQHSIRIASPDVMTMMDYYRDRLEVSVKDAEFQLSVDAANEVQARKAETGSRVPEQDEQEAEEVVVDFDVLNADLIKAQQRLSQHLSLEQASQLVRDAIEAGDERQSALEAEVARFEDAQVVIENESAGELPAGENPQASSAAHSPAIKGDDPNPGW